MASPKRFVMTFLASMAIATGVILVAPATADPNGSCLPGRTWYETESGYHATWHRVGDTDIFNADYTAPDGRHQSTTNKVSIINSMTVRITRLSSTDQHLCMYEGKVSKAGTIDGLYTCGAGRFDSRPWHAVIRCDPEP